MNHKNTKLQWYSDANVAARFKQYDENSCDQTWYKEDGIGGKFIISISTKNDTKF